MKIQNYQDSGNRLKDEGNIDLAIQEYNKALQLNANYIPALNELAQIYESQKEYDRALDYRRKVAELKPDNMAVKFKLAKAIMNQGDLEISSQFFSDILNQNQQYIDAFMKTRSARINILSKINKSTSYLEIGVCKGKTFNEVCLLKKVAIDPNFQFDYSDYQSDNIEFYEITSDDFFRLETADLFDFIYLDGLHTFEQTFRDFCSTISLSNKRTIWLIDDTVPTDSFAAERSQRECRKLRNEAGQKGSSWMGDVFKVVYAIHDFFPQFNYVTFPNHGQTAIWRQTRTSFKPHFNSLSTISNLTFQDFLDTKETIMNLATPTEIISRLKSCFERA